MAFPDSLSNPSRTVVTAEIGKSVSRMRHVIEYEPGKYKRLHGSIEEDVGTLLSLGYVLYGNPWTFKQFDSELKRDSICHCQAMVKFKPSQKE